MGLYRFGNFRLDPATRELHHGETPVAVPPRAFDVLVYLIEQRERAVGRDELIAAVWGRTEIGDGMLGQTILSARRALEDTGKEQQYIRTVIRFGYHWIAPVTLVEPLSMPESLLVPAESASAPAPQDATPAAAARIDPAGVAPRSRRRLWLLPLPLLLIALLLWVVASRRPASDDPVVDAPRGARALVALVMPVQVGAGSGHDWIRLGVMELIATRLREAGLPAVPSDNVVMLLRRPDQADGDPARLAQAAGADLVVATSADALATGWRVTLRTVYGSTPPINATGEARDVLAAARIAADSLAHALGLAPHMRTDSEAQPAGLAMLLGQVDAAILSDRLETARALIREAEPRDRDRPEVHLRVAKIDYQAGDFTAAESGFSELARAVPSEQDAVLHARALTDLGVIAAMRGDLPTATQKIDEAIGLLRPQHAPDALGKALNARGNIAGAQGRYDEALRNFAEARVAFDSAGNVLATAVLDSNLASMDMHRQHYAEAERAFTRAADRFAVFGVNAAELNALTAVAELKLALLEPAAALAIEPRLRELIEAVADPARQRAGQLTRLEVLAANGRLRGLDEALHSLQRAADAASDRAVQAGAHALAAEMALERGDTAAARASANAAVQRLAAGDDPRAQARIRLLQVRAQLADGQSAAGAVAGLAAFADADRSPSARACVAQARAAASGDSDARELHEEALRLADASRIPQDLRDAVDAYAKWLIRRGDFARAATLAERVAGPVARDYASALLRLRVYRALGNHALAQAALEHARALAGDRIIPVDLLPEQQTDI